MKTQLKNDKIVSIVTVLNHGGGNYNHARETRPGDLSHSSHAWTIIMLVYLDLGFYPQKNFCNLILIHLNLHFGHLPQSVHSPLGETAKKMNDYSSQLISPHQILNLLKTGHLCLIFIPSLYLTQYMSYRKCPLSICSTELRNVINSEDGL